MNPTPREIRKLGRGIQETAGIKSAGPPMDPFTDVKDACVRFLRSRGDKVQLYIDEVTERKFGKIKMP